MRCKSASGRSNPGAEGEADLNADLRATRTKSRRSGSNWRQMHRQPATKPGPRSKASKPISRALKRIARRFALADLDCQRDDDRIAGGSDDAPSSSAADRSSNAADDAAGAAKPRNRADRSRPSDPLLSVNVQPDRAGRADLSARLRRTRSLAFFVLMGVYLMISMTASILREQVSA